MWEFIAGALICIFAILGFVALLNTLIFKIYKTKGKNAYIVLDSKSLSEDTEYTLRSWAQRLNWLGRCSVENIIIVDNGLSKESREICRMICRENPLFKICTSAELYKIFH